MHYSRTLLDRIPDLIPLRIRRYMRRIPSHCELPIVGFTLACLAPDEGLRVGTRRKTATARESRAEVRTSRESVQSLVGSPVRPVLANPKLVVIMCDPVLQMLEDRAGRMVERLARGCQGHSLGSATVAIYDTAWVSMISREDEWLFPECFQFILDSQSTSGGWDFESSCEDGILNTLASLLALVRHRMAQNQNTPDTLPELNSRISKAKLYLGANLQIWDIDTTMNVGFEILVPALLVLLENEHISFDFPARKALEKLSSTKLSLFDAEKFYRTPNALLHSLEGLIGRIDFDRLSHHTISGSMMASPASTAAYLIYSSFWDSEAEQYIRDVIRDGSGLGRGGVPSVYPMPVFESTWILTILLRSGFEKHTLGHQHLDEIANYLQDLFQEQEGLVGFAPSVPVDADDTAKTILTLRILEKDISSQQLIDYFQSDNGCFRTYLGERDASFSANCNVLLALLYSPEVQPHILQVVRTVTFLCDAWWAGRVNDKWNSSSQYSRMLLAEVLTQLLYLWDTGRVQDFPNGLLQDKIPTTLTQVLNQTMLDQIEDGSWTSRKSSEITAYGVLTLKSLCSLPWFSLIEEDILSAICLGQSSLRESEVNWTEPVKVWTEKVAYGSAHLSEAYCIAAMRASKPSYNWSRRVASLVTIPEKTALDMVGLFSNLETFHGEPHFKILASATEGLTFLPQLRSAGLDVLPVQKDAKNEYLGFIPLIWVLINNRERLNLSADLLWDMMVLTVCNFRVDEYMETVVANFAEETLEQAKSILHDVCIVETSNVPQPRDHSCQTLTDNNGNDQTATSLPAEYRKALPISERDQVLTDINEGYSITWATKFRATMGNYIRAMLNYPHILNASAADLFNLRCLLHTFLLSHIAQLSDNSRFATQGSRKSPGIDIFGSPRSSFYNWARSTGANSVSCPFSFAFLTCLLGATPPGSHSSLHQSAADCFDSVGQKYLAEDFCSHLAVMSRLYNDLGSIVRDCSEGNINSVNFPEFHVHTGQFKDCINVNTGSSYEERLKRDLLSLAEHERENADLALNRLMSEIERESKGGAVGRKGEKGKAMRLFAGVAKLFADIYVLRDLSNQVKRRE